MSSRRTQRGIVLVIVLWTIVLLSVLIGNMMLTLRSAIQTIQIQAAAAQATALAEAGVYRAIQVLAETPPAEVSQVKRPLEKFQFGTGVVRVAIQDEAGKIDLNRGDPALIDDLLRYFDYDEQQRQSIIDAIQDWSDGDTDARPFGAEYPDYDRQGLDYQPKNAPFARIEELQQVLGISRPLFQRLRPALTVHSGRRNLNINVAPPEIVAAAAGGSPFETEDAEADSSDADSFYDRDRAAEAADSAEDNLAQDLSTTGSRYASTAQGLMFTVSALGETAGAKARIEAVVNIARRANRPYTILSWKEGTY